MVTETLPRRLGEVARLRKGVSYSGMHLDSPGPRLLGLGTVVPGGGLKLDQARTYGGPVRPWQFISPGEMFIALTDITQDGRVLGSPALLPTSVSGEFVVTHHVARVEVIDPNLVDTRWLYYFLQSRPARDYMRGVASGTTVRAVSIHDAEDLPIDLPPLDKQRSISEVLGALDDKIELNRRMSETLDSMARALFQSWFLDFDPVRAKSAGGDTGLPQPLADLFPESFDDSELGPIPSGWKVKGLDEIARFRNGLALQKYPPTHTGSLPVIKIAQLRAGHTEGADQATADLDPDYVVADGDVLFSWSGTLECVLWAGGRGALNQHLFKVASTEYPKWFYYLWIHAHLADFRHIAASKATTMGHIQRHHLSSAMVVDSGLDLLAAADRHLRPLIEAIPLVLAQSRHLASLRDELLPKLLLGALPVKDSETGPATSS